YGSDPTAGRWGPVDQGHRYAMPGLRLPRRPRGTAGGIDSRSLRCEWRTLRRSAATSAVFASQVREITWPPIRHASRGGPAAKGATHARSQQGDSDRNGGRDAAPPHHGRAAAADAAGPDGGGVHGRERRGARATRVARRGHLGAARRGARASSRARHEARGGGPHRELELGRRRWAAALAHRDPRERGRAARPQGGARGERRPRRRVGPWKGG